MGPFVPWTFHAAAALSGSGSQPHLARASCKDGGVFYLLTSFQKLAFRTLSLGHSCYFILFHFKVDFEIYGKIGRFSYWR